MSAVAVFMKDFTQIINILLQLGFFMIPVFWNEADMKPDVVMVLKLNPVFYIVQGYRDSLLDGVPFGNIRFIRLITGLCRGFFLQQGQAYLKNPENILQI